MLTELLASLLSGGSLLYGFRTLSKCQSASRALRSASDDDPLEQRLAEKELRLLVALGRRSVLALSRASLFGGTGLAVWSLTGGSTHYLEAGVDFSLGCIGWFGCSELQRRIGSLAEELRSATSTRSGPVKKDWLA